MDATQNKARLKRAFTLRYWLRRWLVPELELSPRAKEEDAAEDARRQALITSLFGAPEHSAAHTQAVGRASGVRPVLRLLPRPSVDAL